MSTKYHQTNGFKFNPAGLIGLDDSIAKGIAKHLRAREREINTIETTFTTCNGGPFDGQQIELQPINSTTENVSIEFTVGAWRGYYQGSKWISTLEADAPVPVATVTQAPRPRIACDLPAKGFDQLRELLGELSENPADRQAVTRKYTNEQINKARECEPDFKTRRRSAECYFANYLESDTLVTYKIGRCSYTILASIEACERLGKSLLKNKKWFSDKMLTLSGPARAAVATQPVAQVAPMATIPTAPAVQPAPVTIKAPAAVLPEIEQPAKPLEPAKPDQSTIPQSWYQDNPITLKYRDIAKKYHNLKDIYYQTRTSIIETNSEYVNATNLYICNNYTDIAKYVSDLSDAVDLFEKSLNTPPSPAVKIEQPAKPLATTCNPDAARLRAKAIICRAANRPTWAKILEDKAAALDRVDPPEPPPCKHKNKMQRQRPHKTECTRLAKIRHPAGHFKGQNYGEPIRQNLKPPTNEPPAIKPVALSANFYQTNQTERLTPWPALNLRPVTHRQPLSRSKQNEATYPCLPPPSFAASALQPGKTGKPAAFLCPPPFGGYSTSYWITLSCRTKTKPSKQP